MPLILNIPSMWIDCADGFHLDCWSTVYGKKTVRCYLCGTPIWVEL